MEWIKESKFLRATLLIVLLGLLGWLSPFFPLKVIVAFLGILIFAFVLREYAKHLAGFIVLGIILFLIPSSANYYSHIILENFQNWLHLPFVSEVLREVKPSKTLQLPPKLSIERVTNVELRFVDAKEIRVPEELTVSSFDEEIRISGGLTNRKYVIEIGNQGLKELRVDGTAISLTGDCSIELLDINGSAINLKGKMVVQRLYLDGTGVNASGSFEGDTLYADGTGVNLKGEIAFETVRIKGTGISFDLTLINCKSFNVDGTGVNGKVTHTGQGNLFVRANGTGGKITVRNQSNAEIFVESSGIRVVRE
ncbi:hypothetical protein ACSFC1_05735 [Pseudothermotoga sp. U03pept]|uniref:hypothetical protein n=1 Tax=Pseudothermotoga sp. U03pept TaxID=3447012 RepID=UPI003EFF54B7